MMEHSPAHSAKFLALDSVQCRLSIGRCLPNVERGTSLLSVHQLQENGQILNAKFSQEVEGNPSTS